MTYLDIIIEWIKPGHAYSITAVAEEHYFRPVPGDGSAGGGVRQSHARDGSLRQGAYWLTSTAGC